ncbi:filamentous hemagglutinin, partial [Janthinobacterium sp. FW305-129]|uniref:YDG domain-containing protein n=1 Tax=Janthinobacterium sp. FW305-129 TaxID=2775054 RepID=UPI001E3FAA52
VQATGVSRAYDATTDASVTLGDDRVAGDVLDITKAAASFASKNAGVNKTVTVTGIAAGGADAGNYVLENTSALTTATITPALLQVTGVTAQSRSYDTTRNALIAGTPTVQALGSDVVTITGTGTGLFADKNAGVNKAVSVSGYTTDDGNYLLLQPAGLTATITPAVLELFGL